MHSVSDQRLPAEMNTSMSTFIIILIVISIASLVIFHNPEKHSISELKNWFSKELSNIADNLDEDIDKDIRGEYPHEGAQTFNKRGMITYVIHDKHKSRFDISDKSALSSQDIMETDGYVKLLAKVRKLNLSIKLEEIDVEGDGVESFHELDEYTLDYPRYYTVTISGW
jgi:hypothetical protein